LFHYIIDIYYIILSDYDYAHSKRVDFVSSIRFYQYSGAYGELEMSPEKKKGEGTESPANIREMILSKIVSEEMYGKRDFSIMTRLSKKFIDILDALVRLNIFKSRSEAVAALVMKTILSELELYYELKEQAEKLDELEETVKELALKTLRE
jgi:Arc/MetJ-type ribon-helix-helix transcriptional regulator